MSCDYGRNLNGLELTYWRSRTDKEGAALLGAMEYAERQSVTVTLRPQTNAQEAVDAVMGEMGAGVPVVLGDYQTAVLGWEWTANELNLSEEEAQKTVRDAWALWWEETVGFKPPEPTSNAGLHFYMSSPDYVVEFDMQTPEQVNRIHPGGVTSVRIRRVGSIGGAQVILDANGNVIPGAGTDDTFSPTNVPLTIAHWVVDYAPWRIVEAINALYTP